MDQTQWRLIMSLVRQAAKALPAPSLRFSFPDTLVVGMFLWSVAHDRPMCWACNHRHYNTLFRPRQLPSVSQFHRRIRSERVRQILQHVHEKIAGFEVPTALLSIDGKAMPVSSVTKDPDAHRGYASGGDMANGYKLHAVVTEDRRIPCWSVRPINEHEMPIARRLLTAMPRETFTPRTLVLADGNYDSHVLHKTIDRLGGRLVCHLRGMAKHPVTLRQMGAARRELLKAYQHKRPLVKLVLRHREGAERAFSNMSCYGGGLAPLPPFVRRLPRVTRWIGGKLILYHARLYARRVG